MRSTEILVIVPAFNEEASLGDVLREIHRAAPDVDVLVINDGSADQTAQVARHGGARLANLPFNLGIGGAMQTGYLYALRHGYRLAIQVDADGQHDPAQIGRLVAPIRNGEASLVIGSRRLSSAGHQSTALRRFGTTLLSRIVGAITGIHLSDATSGFRAADRSVIEAYAHYYPSDYPEVEALVYLHRQGLRIREVPVTMRERAGGQSSITFRRAVYYMVKVPIASFIGALRRKELS